MSKQQTNGQYDVAVIGGGPAGAALATLLARQGHRCVVLEGSTFPRYHIGESLIPNTYGTLDRLGLLPKLRASHFPKKYSVRFVSPSGEASDPFYFFETIPGERSQTWQVERSAFDQLCLDNARDHGVDVRTATRVRNVLFDNGRAVGVAAQHGTDPIYDLHARVVVDSSGRATVIGSQLGLKRAVPGLVKASIWTYYRGGRRLEGVDAGETTVFMIPRRGWFWYIPLPDDIVSVGVVADPGYLFAESQHFEPVFLCEVDRCAPLSARLEHAVRTAPVRGLRQLAYRNRHVAGDGWVMVGDAAAFLDPIYSSGLFLALGSAEMAAGCVHKALQTGDCSAARLGAFAPSLLQGVEVIRRLIHAFYDPQFTFRTFVERYPEHRPALIDCLVGDVIEKDMRPFLSALATMTPPPCLL
ncbi:MAG: tryptophan 7-halogenase [Planctomycetes bacterium]|nr:tryptophan 7-halogenase [Planctomycetota bacterium]